MGQTQEEVHILYKPKKMLLLIYQRLQWANLSIWNIYTLPSPKHFCFTDPPSLPPHPLHPTPHPSLLPTLSLWVRQETITYHGLNINQPSPLPGILLHCPPPHMPCIQLPTLPSPQCCYYRKGRQTLHGRLDVSRPLTNRSLDWICLQLL